MRKIAVFASGSGSNFQAIIDTVHSESAPYEVSLLVCDKPNAKAIQRAENAGIPTFVFSAKDYNSKAEFETEVIKELEKYKVDFIVLAGYMRLIGPTLLTAFEGSIVNIHPSLLPSFPGKDAIGQAFDANVKITGVTIHYVDEGMDTGPIIAQEAVKVEESDTLETLQKKIQKVEHELYPQTIAEILQQKQGKARI